MEEERKQKLRAGKEKLAQFQKKKRKKKPSSTTEKSTDNGGTLSPVSIQQHAAQLYDSDQLSLGSYTSEEEGSTTEEESGMSQGGRLNARLQQQLRSSCQRVEELEESLMGKQLALDSVIKENERLRQDLSDQGNTEALKDAVAPQKLGQTDNVRSPSTERDGKIGTAAADDKTDTEPKVYSEVDVRELVQHVHWLQLQLQQSNETMRSQNERQAATIGSLRKAQEEIITLKDCVNHKDELVSSLADKLKAISTEYKELRDNVSSESEAYIERNQTLTKALEILKAEHEKAVDKVQDSIVEVELLSVNCKELEIEKAALESKIERLANDKDELSLELGQMQRKLEDEEGLRRKADEEVAKLQKEIENLAVENQRMVSDKSKMEDEFHKLREDNTMFQSQVAEYEDKISQSGDLMEENHSLRLQADELYNKINSQKNLIASSRSEVEVLTAQNVQMQEQVKQLEETADKHNTEQTALNAEKEHLLHELRDLKDLLACAHEDVEQYKKTNAALDDEIQKLRETYDVNDGDETNVTRLPDTNQDPLELVEVSVEELLLATTSEHCFSANQESSSKPDIVKTLQEEIDQLRSELAKQQSETIVSSEINNVVQEIQYSTNTTALHNHDNEQQACAQAIDIQQDSVVSKPESNNLQDSEHSHKVPDSDTIFLSANDTAYSSCLSDPAQTEDESPEMQEMRQRMQELQQQSDQFREALNLRETECHTLRQELAAQEESPLSEHLVPSSTLVARDDINGCEVCGVSRKQGFTISLPTPVVADAKIDVDTDKVLSSDKDFEAVPDNMADFAAPEVSEVHPGSQVLDPEVNMHASSSPIPPADSSLLLSCPLVSVVAHPSEDGSFQNACLDNSDEHSANMSKPMHVNDEVYQTENNEGEIVTQVKDERNKVNESIRYSDKIQELQKENNSLKQSLHDSKGNVNYLESEIEKLVWERDEMNLRVSDLDGQLLEMKTSKCDLENKEELVREQLESMNDRLEYLQSTESDLFEMKETLDKIQAEKESILQDNENLQCSLSAQIEENDRILETMDSLYKDNAQALEERRDANIENQKLSKELKQRDKASSELEARVEKLLKKLNKDETRYVAEIEGLVEENSTLKTRVQTLQAEIEGKESEVERLKAFFPNIDEQSEENRHLKSQVHELETRLAEINKDNEALVCEILESQKLLDERLEERDSLIEKCEEFKTIVADMDNEKTVLLEKCESVKSEMNQIMSDRDVTTEKLELQLNGLDQENATLKTQVVGLKQDLQDALDQAENHEDCDKVDSVKTLEQTNRLDREKDDYTLNTAIVEPVSLVTSELYDTHTDTNSNKTGITAHLESDISVLIEENKLLRDKCRNADHELTEMKQNEEYLKEQMKIYEQCANTADNSTGDIERLQGQLELEFKYKKRMQKDLERAQEEISKLQMENRSLSNELQVLSSENENLQSSMIESEKKLKKACEQISAMEQEQDIVRATVEESKSVFEQVTAERDKLKHEVSTLQTHLHAVSENRNHIRTQVEILAAELEYQSDNRNELVSRVNGHEAEVKDLKQAIAVLEVEKDEACSECDAQTFEASRLQEECDAMKEDMLCMQDSLTKVDEILDQNVILEEEMKTLKKTLGDLKMNLDMVKKDRDDLEMMSGELNGMLHDMQTKYEDVKSEMEGTKKKCDKEISHLQKQLTIMNSDVSELRKMLDLMENEMYSAVEEKVSLKENLQQQQAQYEEAVEQKQKLEEILTEKHQKDLKNMKMVTQRNQRSDQMQCNANAAELNIPSGQSLRLNENVCTPEDVSEVLHSVQVDPSETSRNIEFRAADHLLHTSTQTDISVGELEACESLTGNTGSQGDCFEIGIQMDTRFDEITSETVASVATVTQIGERGTETVVEDLEAANDTIDGTKSKPVLNDSYKEPRITAAEEEVLESEGRSERLSLNIDMGINTALPDVDDNDLSVMSVDSGILSAATQDIPNCVFKFQEAARQERLELEVPSSIGLKNMLSVECQTDIGSVDSSVLSGSVLVNMLTVKSQTEEDLLDSLVSGEIDKRTAALETEIEARLIASLDCREQFVKAREDGYDRKVKQIEYEMEERFMQDFRMREAEVMVEAEKFKKKHADEVEQAANKKIERMKIEKDQQFVEELQKVRVDMARRARAGLHHSVSTQDYTSTGLTEKLRHSQSEGQGLEDKGQQDQMGQTVNGSQPRQLPERVMIHQFLQALSPVHNIMAENPHTSAPNMPSWLDWDRVPDLSFDSLRSSTDIKSLSGSLEESAFCSNSDCLTVRMKYEHLMERIRQFMQMGAEARRVASVHASEGNFDETDSDDAGQFESECPEEIAGKFVEHKEPAEQMLERMTSFDLEHSARAPRRQTAEGHGHYVNETESTDMIIDQIVDESEQGHFSENELDDENDQSDTLRYEDFIQDEIQQGVNDSSVAPFSQCRASEIGDGVRDTFEKRRHYSDSDMAGFSSTVELKTALSENTEGHFVLEQAALKTTKDVDDEDDVFFDDGSFQKPSNTVSEGFERETDEFEEEEPGRKLLKFEPPVQIIKPVEQQQSILGLDLAVDASRFVVEKTPIDEKAPGATGSVILSRSPVTPKTGEESGDFFQSMDTNITRQFCERLAKPSLDVPSVFVEKEGYKDERIDSGDILETFQQEEELEATIVPVSQAALVDEAGDRAQKSSAVKKQTHRRTKSLEVHPLVPSQALSADFSQVLPPYSEGQQSYENVIFDVLNNICPGTDPSRIPGFKRDVETFSTEVPTLEGAADEFSEPASNDLQAAMSRCQELMQTIEVLQLKLSEQKRKLDNEMEQSKAKKAQNDQLENENVKLKSEAQKYDSMLMDAEKLASHETNELKAEVEYLKQEVAVLKETEEKQQICVDDLKKDIGSSKEEIKRLTAVTVEQKGELKELRSENESLSEENGSVSKKNDDLKDEQDIFIDEVRTLREDKEILTAKVKIFDELKSEQSELKGKICELEKEKVDLGNELQTALDKITHEKIDVENALLTQGDMMTVLEKENNDMKEKLKELENLENKDIQISALQNEIIALQTNISSERSCNGGLKSQIRMIAIEMKALKEENAELQKSSMQLVEDKKQLLQDLESEKQSALNLQEEREKLARDTKLVENQNEELRNKLTVDSDQCTRLLRRVESLESEVECLNANITSYQKKLAESEISSSDRCGELEATLENITKEKYDLEGKLIQTEITIEVLKSAENEMCQTKAMVEKENDQLKKEVLSLTERAEEDEWALKELATQLESIELTKKEATEGLTAQVQPSLKSENRPEGVEKASGKQSVEDLTNQLKALELSKKQLEDDLTNQIEQLESSKNEADAVMAELRKEVEELKQELDIMKETGYLSKSGSETDLYIVEDMKDAIKALQDQKEAIEQENTAHKRMLEKSNSTMKIEIDQLTSDNEDLKRQLKEQGESLKSENTEVLNMYNDLREEVEKLVISKHDLEMELHALKDLLEHDSESGTRPDHDSSRELTIQDIEEMEDLKNSIGKLKTDLKKKDSYVKKLEEHLLQINMGLPDFKATPHPQESSGVPSMSRSMLKFRRGLAGIGRRRAISHDLPQPVLTENTEEPLQTLDGSLHASDLDSTLSEKQFEDAVRGSQASLRPMTSSQKSSLYGSLNASGSLTASERVRSGLSPKEDGHLALELKQFELVDEITKLRRDFRETKAVYAQETALLSEALEKEKTMKERQRFRSDSAPPSESIGHLAETLRIRQELAKQKDENKLLKMEAEMWLKRLKEQEQIVSDLRDRYGRSRSGYEEIGEVFGKQLALLQKQREELIDRLHDRDIENSKLSAALGENGIVQETLRKEKELLIAKLQEKADLESELNEKQVMLDQQRSKQKELEEVIHKKDLKEIELMKQKRMLQEEIKEIESKFKDREEDLGYVKNKLLDELRDKSSLQNRSRFSSESEDDRGSVCSDSMSLSLRSISELEEMRKAAEKQHATAVRVLRDKLKTDYTKRERALRDAHRADLARLSHDMDKQV